MDGHLLLELESKALVESTRGVVLDTCVQHKLFISIVPRTLFKVVVDSPPNPLPMALRINTHSCQFSGLAIELNELLFPLIRCRIGSHTNDCTIYNRNEKFPVTAEVVALNISEVLVWNIWLKLRSRGHCNFVQLTDTLAVLGLKPTNFNG